ncbi:MAG TPA: hypothetical protein VGQ65_14550 [Thermoanaerobaculia bacterium]|nr:hypothetical protein [Thermoanaerobaculia bacterium]
MGYGSHAGFAGGTRTASFATHAAKALNQRRTIPIELPKAGGRDSWRHRK